MIDIRESILSENDNIAEMVRDRLKKEHVFMMNLMASPGAGKTSLILQTIQGLAQRYRIGIIEGDIDSMVDSEKVAEQGVPTIQLRTGGACHLDAPMIDISLNELRLNELDFVVIENIGNLVCPAEFDTGADIRVMISSVPEGDDKVLKYPLMFSVCDALVINKIDYLPDPGFDVEVLKRRVKNLNPSIRFFEVSCRNGDGISAWIEWLAQKIEDKQT